MIQVRTTRYTDRETEMLLKTLENLHNSFAKHTEITGEKIAPALDDDITRVIAFLHHILDKK